MHKSGGVDVHSHSRWNMHGVPNREVKKFTRGLSVTDTLESRGVRVQVTPTCVGAVAFRNLPLVRTGLLIAALAFAALAWAHDVPRSERDPPRGMEVDGSGGEAYSAGCSLALENDLFSFSGRDGGYTGGVAVTFGGRRAAE